MPDAVAATPSPAAADAGLTMTAVAPAAHAAAPDHFHQLLSEMNPLQYIPVIGTLYRSVTGDNIPQSAREIGGLVFSGVVSGPFGVATSLATLALEKITGIDPEAIGQTLLSDIGIGHAPTPTVQEPQPLPLNTPTPTASAAAPAAHAATASAAAAPTASAATPVAWSPAQLTAYGVTKTATGELQRGEVRGADVLNDLELARHQAAPAGA